MDILIVDDSLEFRILHKYYLESAGYNDLHFADSAQEAFRILGMEEGAPDTPVNIDLVLMDIQMPEIDGIEACRIIKANRRLKNIPIIMLTSMNEPESLKSAFKAGAMDYITKQNAKVELLVRVRSALALKQEMDMRRAREMEIADIGSTIQDTLLYSKPPETDGLQIAALTIPSQRIDGDFFDFFKHSDHCLDVLIADVMGKGVSAALLGAATKTHFFRAVHQLFSSLERKRIPRADEIVMSVHNEVTKQLIRLDKFVTLCYARFDLKKRLVYIVDCGHTKTIHYHHADQTYSTLEGPNVPLGLLEDERYRQIPAFIETGDILFFYSDGVSEARSESGDFFGETRLGEMIKNNSLLPPDALIDELCHTLVSFCNSEKYADDLTCIAVKIVG